MDEQKKEGGGVRGSGGSGGGRVVWLQQLQRAMTRAVMKERGDQEGGEAFSRKG